MATIVINRLANRTVEIIRDGVPKYRTSVSNIFMEAVKDRDGADLINVTFKDDYVIQLRYADITTINGVAKPALVADGLKTLATDVFSIGGGDVSSGVTQAQLDAAIAAYDAGVVTTYKRKDKFIDLTVSLDFPSIAAGAVSAGITISDSTTTGITSSWRIALALSSNMNKSLVIYGIAGTNLVTFYAINTSAAAIDNVNGTYRVTAINAG